MSNVLRVAALAAIALVGVSAAIAAAPASAPLSGAIAVSSDEFATATLAPLGSFSFEAAPLETQLAVQAHATAAGVRNGSVSVDDATRITAAGHQVYALLVEAHAACAENSHTGKCTGSLAKARHLLRQASAAFAAIQ